MAKEKNNEVTDFVNPFNEGVNYKMFLDAKGNQSVEDYCAGKLTQDQIKWLIEDLKFYTNK